MTKDKSFKLVEPFKVGYRGGSLPMLIAENSLGFTAQIEIQECDLDVDQARALRDWLTSVLPGEPRADANSVNTIGVVAPPEPECKHERQSTGLNEDGTTWIYCNVCKKMLFEGVPPPPNRGEKP